MLFNIIHIVSRVKAQTFQVLPLPLLPLQSTLLRIVPVCFGIFGTLIRVLNVVVTMIIRTRPVPLFTPRDMVL